MPYYPPGSFDYTSHPVSDALIMSLLALLVYMVFVRPMVNAMIGLRIRGKLEERWRSALDEARWDALDPAELGLGGFVSSDWAFERDDGARLWHESDFLTSRVVFTADLSGRVPPGWGFDVELAQGAARSEPVGERLRESASLWMRARGGLGDLTRALARLAEPLASGLSRARLEDETLRVEMGALGNVDAAVRPRRDLLRDPGDMMRRIEAVISELERMAEFSDQTEAATLAEQLVPGSPYLEEAFIALLAAHPDAPETRAALDGALLPTPRLERLALVYATDARVWESWQSRGGLTSYVRARVAGLPRMPAGEGRARLVSDLLARASAAHVEELFASFSFEEGTGENAGDDRLFANLGAWQDAYTCFVQEAIALDPQEWIVVFSRYHDRVHSAWGFDASHLTRDHLLMAVREADHMLDMWLEQLEGDDAQDVVDALLARLRRELEWGSYTGAIDPICSLADALAARSVTAALPLLHEALDLHGDRTLTAYRIAPIERAIAVLSEGIDPGVVGGVSVAEQPAAQGGLSVATARAGDLSESAAESTGVALDLEAGEEVEVGEEVEAG